MLLVLNVLETDSLPIHRQHAGFIILPAKTFPFNKPLSNHSLFCVAMNNHSIYICVPREIARNSIF